MNLEPSTQKNLYGHKLTFKTLTHLYVNNKLPSKILLSGEKGIGKCTLAYHLINFVLSKDEEYSYNYKNCEINFENKSFKLIQNNSNPNFNLIDVAKDKKNIDITQIRELILNLNKSSFNLKKRFVLIDNIELLNTNSVNALLKVLEEPNENINFILINNNKRVISTLMSRCVNFKVFLTHDATIEVINKILSENIYDLVNSELIDNYSTPGHLFKLLNFSKDYKIDLINLNLRDFLTIVINDKIYKKESYISQFIYSFIELYFRENISMNNINLLKLYTYFIKKIRDTKIYNLDEESIFMEFENKVLNG